MKNITQEKMAQFIGISPQHFSDIKLKRKSLGKKSALRIYREGKANAKDAFSLQDVAGSDFVSIVKRLMLTTKPEEESK